MKTFALRDRQEGKVAGVLISIFTHQFCPEGGKRLRPEGEDNK
jgi:hypothetical protein